MSKVGGSPGDGWSPEDQTEVLVAEILQNEGWTLARAPFIDSESEYGENAPVSEPRMGSRLCQIFWP